mmetsp:Transcript_64194/g.202930  ORF Transcript_64194/g.202930 Transcript_64194/m.202930 type:complete len:80 (-) Transcript_64194:188-427(-)
MCALAENQTDEKSDDKLRTKWPVVEAAEPAWSIQNQRGTTLARMDYYKNTGTALLTLMPEMRYKGTAISAKALSLEVRT